MRFPCANSTHNCPNEMKRFYSNFSERITEISLIFFCAACGFGQHIVGISVELGAMSLPVLIIVRFYCSPRLQIMSGDGDGNGTGAGKGSHRQCQYQRSHRHPFYSFAARNPIAIQAACHRHQLADTFAPQPFFFA